MAYGSPETEQDILPYYTDIRRGRAPSETLLAELVGRYQSIGGKSPLLEITQAQAKSVEESSEGRYKAYVGMRHWQPWIKDALAEMQADGITDAVGIVMAPHYSSMSVAKYMEAVAKACEDLSYNLHFNYISDWHNEDEYIIALAENIQQTRARFHADVVAGIKYIFTAHSLPEKILEANDPYVMQLMKTSELLAEKCGIDPDRWTFAFQSAGRTEEKWLGPDLLEVIDSLAQAGEKDIIVCSVGFITDHLEVMFDIDIEAKRRAAEYGMILERAPSLNAHPYLGKLFDRLATEKFDKE